MFKKHTISFASSTNHLALMRASHDPRAKRRTAKNIKRNASMRFLSALITLFLFSVLSKAAFAAFPNDFSDVVWRDPNISSWPQTATLTVSHDSSALRVVNNKRAVWPTRFHSVLQSNCCNANVWVFARFNGVWNAATFEYMRFNQINKGPYTVNGNQVKGFPFQQSGGYVWTPRKGEVIAFMVSGMARDNLNNVNVRERSNVYLYRWGVGPTDNIIDDPVEPEPEPDPEPEICVEPEPEVNLHTYNGTVGANAIVTTPTGTIPFYEEEAVRIVVSDDRSLTMTIDGRSITSTVQQNNSFSGTYEFDIDFLPNCRVSVNVSGNLNGNNITGIGTGNEACGDFSATLNATFSASSPTAPSFLDQRPQSNVCGVDMSPIHMLLLERN